MNWLMIIQFILFCIFLDIQIFFLIKSIYVLRNNVDPVSILKTKMNKVDEMESYRNKLKGKG